MTITSDAPIDTPIVIAEPLAVLLPRFEYLHATSLRQAATLLAENPAAQALGGGTDLLVDLRERRRQPSVLVDVADLAELKGIEADDGVTRIGAG